LRPWGGFWWTFRADGWAVGVLLSLAAADSPLRANERRHDDISASGRVGSRANAEGARFSAVAGRAVHPIFAEYVDAVRQ
jgi:hypothetical protein